MRLARWSWRAYHALVITITSAFSLVSRRNASLPKSSEVEKTTNSRREPTHGDLRQRCQAVISRSDLKKISFAVGDHRFVVSVAGKSWAAVQPDSTTKLHQFTAKRGGSGKQNSVHPESGRSLDIYPHVVNVGRLDRVNSKCFEERFKDLRVGLD